VVGEVRECHFEGEGSRRRLRVGTVEGEKGRKRNKYPK